MASQLKQSCQDNIFSKDKDEPQSQIQTGVKNDAIPNSGQDDVMKPDCSDSIRDGIKKGFKGNISLWKQMETEHREKQLINPFSEWEGASHRPKMDKNDPLYGKPVPGSLTDIRGKQASNHVFGEIRGLCRDIDALGVKGEDDKMRISFGRLFQAYEAVSSKLVGILMRARKRGCLTFPGEMLYQGRDEAVMITLLEIPEDTREEIDVPKDLSSGFV
ncbi:hypothetical protein SNE40_009065 [Patella caerulea]|uniref:Costars domain-containing protein n=1 Tax=Patella caerulea TaxID=87958 RepID=A0AAN8PPL8_PATCE